MGNSCRAARPLGCMSFSDCRALCPPGPGSRAKGEQTNLSLRRMMHWSFFIIAAVTLASAVAAISLRNIVHCALLLTITFAGLAMFYLQLNAQFIGFAQVLVYIGAVAILIVFAILLTRSSDIAPAPRALFSWGSGIAIALLLFATLAKAISQSGILRKLSPAPPPSATV